MHFKIQRPLKFWRVTLKTLTQPSLQFRVARLPQLVADMYLLQIDVAVAERKQSLAFRGWGFCTAVVLQLTNLNLVNASTLFLFFRFPRVEHDTVARL